MTAQEEQAIQALIKIRRAKKFNYYMLWFDVAFAVIMLATNALESAAIMVACSLMVALSIKSLEKREQIVLSMLDKPDRKNKTKKEDLYPNK